MLGSLGPETEFKGKYEENLMDKNCKAEGKGKVMKHYQ
jgi:hypothetical protein